MKLGILKPLKPEDDAGIPGHGTEEDRFRRFFEQVNAPFTIQLYDVTQGEFPASPDECDAYLISGSDQGVYDNEPWIPVLAQFIRDCYAAQRKMVGICFGHQMLAHTLGGHTEKSHKGWGLGLREIELVSSKAWMTPPLDNLQLNFAHQDQVIHLPPNAELLATNDFCPNIAFSIGNQVFGLQAHPEINNPFMEAIVDYMESRLDDAAYQEAINTLSAQPDSRPVAQWIVNFLQQPSPEEAMAS